MEANQGNITLMGRVPTPTRNLYQAKYKGIGIALDMFGHALHGG